MQITERAVCTWVGSGSALQFLWKIMHLGVLGCTLMYLGLPGCSLDSIERLYSFLWEVEMMQIRK